MPPQNPQHEFSDEDARLIAIAMKYTDGDADKARLMVTGEYSDVCVVKGKTAVKDWELFGAFILFLNTVRKSVCNVVAVFSPRKETTDGLHVTDEWKTFYSDMMYLTEGDVGDPELLNGFVRHFADSLEGYDIFSGLYDGNIDEVSTVLGEIIGKFFGTGPLLCQIDMVQSSSLALELEGVSVQFCGAENTGDLQPKTELELRLHAIESQAEFVISGKVIVSPVRGTYINDVRAGQMIRLLLVDQDEASRKVAKVLKALNEKSEYVPVKGRLIEKVPLEKSGYVLYVQVAKNVLVKIVEEENVKIEMETPPVQRKEESKGDRLIIYIVLFFGLILLTLLLLFVTL